MYKLDYEKPEGEFNVPSYTSIQLTELTELLLRNYLYNTYLNKINGEEIVVDKVLSFHSAYRPIPRLPILNFDSDKNCYQFPDPAMNFSVRYKNVRYECSSLVTNEMFDEFQPLHTFHITGISNEAKEVNALAELIHKNALKNSPLRNKTLSIKLVGNEKKDGQLLEGINIITPPSRKLDENFRNW